MNIRINMARRHQDGTLDQVGIAFSTPHWPMALPLNDYRQPPATWMRSVVSAYWREAPSHQVALRWLMILAIHQDAARVTLPLYMEQGFYLVREAYHPGVGKYSFEMHRTDTRDPYLSTLRFVAFNWSDAIETARFLTDKGDGMRVRRVE